MRPIDLSIFPLAREQGLKSVERYVKFDVMFYRSNLWQHTQRVLWITEHLIPTAQKYFEFDPEKARALALVHDDPEIITGDTPGDYKTKMTAEEVQAHELQEMQAIEELARIYPQTVHGYSYKELLMHALKKDCPETWLVSYADKLDAYGETMHDILAGNHLLLWSLVFYTRVFMSFPKKFPELTHFLESTESPFTNPKNLLPPDNFKTDTYTKLGKPHTAESLRLVTDFPVYDAWKEIVLNRGGEEGLRWLTQQKESY